MTPHMTPADIAQMVDAGRRHAPRILKRLSFGVDEARQEVTVTDGAGSERIPVADFLAAFPVLISENP